MTPRPPGRRRAAATERRGALARPAERLLRELRKIRRDPADVEAVHDARVALRRLRSAGELWASHLPTWQPLRDRLPRFLKRLGRLRNIDVAISFLDGGPKSERPARRELAKALKRERRKEREGIADWLTPGRIRKLEEAAREAVDEIRRKPVLDLPGPPRLEAHFARILSLFPGAADSERAHEIRREVRRLRYAHETLEWAYDPADFRAAVGALRRIQEIAGEWQDRCVVEALAARVVRKGRIARPLTGFLARLQAEAKILSARFVRAIEGLAELRRPITGGGP